MRKSTNPNTSPGTDYHRRCFTSRIPRAVKVPKPPGPQNMRYEQYIEVSDDSDLEPITRKKLRIPEDTVKTKSDRKAKTKKTIPELSAETVVEPLIPIIDCYVDTNYVNNNTDNIFVNSEAKKSATPIKKLNFQLPDKDEKPDDDDRMDWQDYHQLAVIHQFLDDLETNFPSLCTTGTIGTSVEGRNLKILKISNSNVGNAAVWVDAGIHAREWIAPAVNTYIADQISRNFGNLPESITNKDWYFLPVLNPDGYHYSHTTDRMWRKNRARYGGHCVGVDLNRNFSVGWGGKGSSDQPTNAFYRGPTPFSEPETKAMRDIFLNSGIKFKVYITLHSYGQIIIFPYACSSELAPDYVPLLEGATTMSKAIYNHNGNIYKVGISRDVMYGASGTSNDFAHGVAGIPFCYLIELRSKKHKFRLPKEEIEETGKEILSCIKALMEFVDSNTYNNKEDPGEKNDVLEDKDSTLKRSDSNVQTANSNIRRRESYDKKHYSYAKASNSTINLKDSFVRWTKLPGKGDSSSENKSDSEEHDTGGSKTSCNTKINEIPSQITDKTNIVTSELPPQPKDFKDKSDSFLDLNDSFMRTTECYKDASDTFLDNTDSDVKETDSYMSKANDYMKKADSYIAKTQSYMKETDSSYRNRAHYYDSKYKFDEKRKDFYKMRNCLVKLTSDSCANTDVLSKSNTVKVAPTVPKTQVWEVRFLREGQRHFVKTLDTVGAINIWKEERSTMDIMVDGPRAAQVAGILHERDIPFSIAISDIATLIEREQGNTITRAIRRSSSGPRKTMDWMSYHRLDTIYAFMENLAAEYPYLCSVSVIGRSVEGRDIKMLKISNGNTNNAGVWMDGAIHPREWISPAVVTYIADRIVRTFNELPDSVTNKDWYILPVMNPDGYEYTHTHDRMWRKNRARYGECVGVDLNRNFSYGFGEKGEEGSSDDPGNVFFRGPSAFSEPETAAVRRAISEAPCTFKVFLSFHSYGEVIIFPWGYTSDPCPDYVELLEGGTAMAKAIYTTNGHTYKVGSTKDLMYYAAGTSIDWSYAVNNIPYSYMVELRSKTHRFLLPKEEIVSTATEILNGVFRLMDFVDRRCAGTQACACPK